MTEHERAVIAEWREAGRGDMVDLLTKFAADIDGYSPEGREHLGEMMFGAPRAEKPVGILHARVV